MRAASIAIIVSGFPRRSETFLLNEMLALDAHGLLGAIFATKPGDKGGAQPGSETLARRVQYLEPGSPDDQAAEVASRLEGRPVRGIHAYFGHEPAEVAAGAARRLRLRYGFSLHARDARKVSPEALAARARAAACVVGCNDDVVAPLRARGVDVRVIPHGVDLQRFRPGAAPPGRPMRLLAVGRLVPKKGFAVLIDAVARVTAPVHLRIVGEGPDLERLRAAIAAAELEDRVELVGSRTHRDLPRHYAQAQAVVVPSIEDGSGDRDGLPNVVLEAMASARPVVASRVGAIASAVSDGRTGLLVPPADAAALAAALDHLSRQPAVRARLGRAGRERVERRFELGRCTTRLRRHLEAVYLR